MMNLCSFLDFSAAKYPAKAAVICGNTHITYSKMKMRVDVLTSSLLQLGMKKGTKAAVLSFNSIQYVEILFALMKIGAVGVPVNHRLTKDEIRFIVEYSGAEFIFYEIQLQEKVPTDVPSLTHYIAIGDSSSIADTYYEELFTFSSHTPSPPWQVSPGDASFILSTAGTTGTPKGVLLTHGNLLWNTLNYSSAYQMMPSDRELATTSMFHCSTLGRIFTYVFNSITFILCKKFEPVHCLDIIQHEKVTSITQAPTMFHMMATALSQRSWNTESVRRVVTGASAMPVALKKQLPVLFPMAGMFDLYGLTEAGPGVSILRPEDFFRKIESIGKPMLSVQIDIKGEKNGSLPPGHVGEITCRGPNVMKEYYKQPDETADVLRDGWLYTGDLGRMDSEGFLYIVGRKKELVISGGMNIFPGEVEMVLSEHPAVEEAAVVGIPDELWGEKAVAAIVIKKNKICREQELLDFCKKRLADFKCPKSIHFVAELPRNAAQKIRKQQLIKQIINSSLPKTLNNKD